MRLSLTTPLLCAALLAPLAAQAGSAEVQFVNPERYSDADTGRDAERVRDALRETLQALAQKRLPDGQTLHVEVLDIDLAGRRLPFSRWGNDVRVVNGRADWPHLVLRFSLNQGEQVLASGQADLADMNYLDHQRLGMGNQLLRYEQPMLQAWFDGTLAKTAVR